MDKTIGSFFMRTKELKETIIKTKQIVADGIRYTYILSVKISEHVASYKLPLYSVSVRMEMPDGNETNATAENAFADVGKALTFFENAVRYLVTPIDLKYVLEDEKC